MYMMISPGPEPNHPSGAARALTPALPQSWERALAELLRYPVTLVTMLATVVLSMGWPSGPVFPLFNVAALGFNLYWLWVFGKYSEIQFGRPTTFGLMLLFGLVTLDVDLALMDRSTGLSGIVFGLFGLFAVLGIRHPNNFHVVDRRTIIVFGSWFFLCCALSAMDLASLVIVAQISGAALGCLTGLAFDYDPDFCHTMAQTHWRLGNYAQALVVAERSCRYWHCHWRHQVFLAAVKHQLAPDDVRADFWHDLNLAVLNPRDREDAEEPSDATSQNETMLGDIDRLVPFCQELFLLQHRKIGWLGPSGNRVRYALQLAFEAHQRDPCDVTVLCAMSFMHGLLGEHEASVNTAHNAAWLRPDLKYCCQALAAALARLAAHFQKAGRSDEAVLAFRDALAYDTSEAHAWHWLCFALTNLGIPDDAMKVAQRGLKRYRPKKSFPEILACQQAELYRSPKSAAELHQKIRKMVADYCRMAARQKHFRLRTALPMSRETLLLLHAIVEFRPYDAIVWCGISVVAGMMGDKEASLAAAQKAISLQRIDPCCRQTLETAKSRME